MVSQVALKLKVTWFQYQDLNKVQVGTKKSFDWKDFLLLLHILILDILRKISSRVHQRWGVNQHLKVALSLPFLVCDGKRYWMPKKNILTANVMQSTHLLVKIHNKYSIRMWLHHQTENKRKIERKIYSFLCDQI